MFPADHRVAIRATDRRPKASIDYLVLVERGLAKRLKLGNWAVLVFAHPALADPAALKLAEPFLAIHCRVELADAAPPDPDAPGVEGLPLVAVDQTLRNALGVPFRAFPHLLGGEFYLLPADRPVRAQVRRDFAQIFGIRYLAMRCQNAHVTDIEKRYARVPGDVLKAVGAQEAGNLVLERPLPMVDDDGIIRRFVICEYRMSTLAAGDRFLDRRDELKTSFPERYADSQRTLYDYAAFEKAGLLPEMSAADRTMPEPDIPPIFLDADARAGWGSADRLVPGYSRAELARIETAPATFVTPIMIRRSIGSAVASDALQTGIAFLIVLIQFTLAVDLDPDRVSTREIFWALFVALFISAALLRARLRQQV